MQHGAFSKKLAVVLVCFLFILAGLVVDQQSHASVLEQQVRASIDTLAHSYRSLAEEEVFPYENSRILNQEQRRAVVRVRTTHSASGNAQSIEDAVASVHALQSALIAFVDLAGSGDSFVDAVSLASLRKTLGAQSPLRTQIDAYNMSADAWNASQGSPFAVLRGQLLWQSDAPLPYVQAEGADTTIDG